MVAETADRIGAVRANAINQAYENPQRQADIADYVNATPSYLTDDLNRQKVDTDRELKFAPARGGLAGGSTQIDQQGRVAENISRGLLDAQRKDAGAGADLQAMQDQGPAPASSRWRSPGWMRPRRVAGAAVSRNLGGYGAPRANAAAIDSADSELG